MTLFEESEAIVADLRSQGFRSAIEAAYAQDGTQLNSSDYWFPKSGRRNYSPFRRHLGGERQEQSPPHVQDLKPPSTDKPRTPQEKPPHQEETIPNPPGVDPGYDPNRPFWNRPPDRLDPRYRNYDPSPHQDAPNDYIGSPFYYEPWLPFSPLRRFNLPREVVIPILQRGVEDKMSLLSVDPSDPNAKVYLKIRPSIAQISVRAGSSSKWAYNGTGFFVTRDGQLATAYHVVDDAQEIQVKTSNGDVYQARVKEKRPTVDLAVLELIDKKPGETFIPLPIAKSSSSLKPGDEVTVVGHPEGFPAMVVSQGTMIKRQIVADGPGPTADENPNNVILRADIHIRGGNSGGPFLNDKGEVVGVVNFREYYSRGQFMPVEDLRAMIKDENGKALGDPRSHIIPASLHFGSHTQMVGSSGLLGVTSGLSHAYLKMNPASKIAAYGRLPGYMMLTAVGAADMPGDYRFFENAMANGSTAERISAGINLGGDAAMTGGAALGMLSRLKKAGLAVALLGVGAKLANDVLADRDMS